MASGTWFGETSRQSQAETFKQQHTGISPNHVPEAVPRDKRDHGTLSNVYLIKKWLTAAAPSLSTRGADAEAASRVAREYTGWRGFVRLRKTRN